MTHTARKLGGGDVVPLFLTRSIYLLIIEVEVHYSTEISHSCTKTQKQLQLYARGSIVHPWVNTINVVTESES